MHDPSDERRQRVLADGLDAFECGELDRFERLCHDHPDLEGELRGAANTLRELNAAGPSIPISARPAKPGRTMPAGNCSSDSHAA